VAGEPDERLKPTLDALLAAGPEAVAALRELVRSGAPAVRVQAAGRLLTALKELELNELTELLDRMTREIERQKGAR
jgi:hypothetical protein